METDTKSAGVTWEVFTPPLGMIKTVRRFIVVSSFVAGLFLLLLQLAFAEDAPPFTMGKQFSADQTITSKNGVLAAKVYVDSGKVRLEFSGRGTQTINIIRPDLQKIYAVLPEQKLIMEVPYGRAGIIKRMSVVDGPAGKFELLGPDLMGGVACTKYKVTSADGRVNFLWINPAKQAPVKMDMFGAFTIQWTNYRLGPQDVALFDPPTDYKSMKMPAGSL
jgi:hypothetical protein